MTSQEEFGSRIRKLRTERGMTQLELATSLSVSDRTVSKWETGRGYPDITFLEKIALIFSLSVSELLSGDENVNRNIPGNMMKTSFYVCPVCGNILTATGEAGISCHGIALKKLEKKAPDESEVSVEVIEDEYFVTISHPMTKKNHISFIAALSSERLQLVKLYPEGNAEARVKMNGVREILYYSTSKGLYSFNPRKLNRTE